MKKYLIKITLIMCLAFPASAFAGVPLETVKANSDKVLNVLRDPSLKPASAKNTDEKIVFSKEIELTEKTVEVQSTVFRRTTEIPIYYRAVLKNGEWRVYDVVIEGVSLINNYRTQFREILSNKPPEALLETLRKKVGRT